MITQPKGFRASGVACGQKASGGLDLALVVNDGPEFVAAGVLTSNRVAAAPVYWTREVLADSRVDAVVLNSGGANACTGADGYADSRATAHRAAELLNVSAGDVAVCSTGIIGSRLNMDAILSGVEAATKSLSPDGANDASRAILTTDTAPKTALWSDEQFTVAGMAKGAGMIAPAMATMLCVITTDAKVEPALAQRALERAVSLTFNRIDSDGCMSTNDTVILMANGASDYVASTGQLEAALESVCGSLARQMISDAEGASHDILIRVEQAASEHGALEVARAISRSNLLKCAIFGNDPNWGRILAAAGTVPEEVSPFDPDDMDVYLNGVCLARGGTGTGAEDEVSLGDQREVEITVVLNAGHASAHLWTNDLTTDYVHENSAYTS